MALLRLGVSGKRSSVSDGETRFGRFEAVTRRRFFFNVDDAFRADDSCPARMTRVPDGTSVIAHELVESQPPESRAAHVCGQRCSKPRGRVGGAPRKARTRLRFFVFSFFPDPRAVSSNARGSSRRSRPRAPSPPGDASTSSTSSTSATAALSAHVACASNRNPSSSSSRSIGSGELRRASRREPRGGKGGRPALRSRSSRRTRHAPRGAFEPRGRRSGSGGLASRVARSETAACHRSAAADTRRRIRYAASASRNATAGLETAAARSARSAPQVTKTKRIRLGGKIPRDARGSAESSVSAYAAPHASTTEGSRLGGSSCAARAISNGSRRSTHARRASGETATVSTPRAPTSASSSCSAKSRATAGATGPGDGRGRAS